MLYVEHYKLDLKNILFWYFEIQLSNIKWAPSKMSVSQERLIYRANCISECQSVSALMPMEKRKKWKKYFQSVSIQYLKKIECVLRAWYYLKHFSFSFVFWKVRERRILEIWKLNSNDYFENLLHFNFV